MSESNDEIREYREGLLKELTLLGGMLNNEFLAADNKDRIQVAIGLLLEELYSEDDIDAYEDDSEGMSMGEYIQKHYDKDVQDIRLTPELSDMNSDDVEAALDADGRKYVLYEHVMTAKLGTRWARKGWDNNLNSEYIMDVPGIGWCKHFTSTSRINSFKLVCHNYVPSKQDIGASDWYEL